MSNFSITLFIAFTGLHRPICFTLTFLSEFVVKYPKTSSFYWILLCTNSSFTKATHSFSFLLKKYHTLSQISPHYFISQPFHHVCHCWRKKFSKPETEAIAFDENFISSSHQVTLREKCFASLSALCFLFFIFSFLLFGLLRPLPQICRVSLTQTHQKVLNQVTVSNEHINHLFWA